MAKNEDLLFLEKIKKLFEYRGIPELFALGSITDTSFEHNLWLLQSSIYDLDTYLETTWHLEESRIGEFWESIKKRLVPILADSSKQEKYLYQIKVYLKREMGLRLGHFPLNTSLKHFYYYKSCDVRLMRRLIWEKSVSNRTYLKPSNWHLFDLVTEVNDDIDDVFEDLEIFNCNRLLFECHFNGLDHTHQLFRDFLLELKSINDIRPGELSSSTEEVIQKTLELLDQRINALELVDFGKTRLFSMINTK